MKRISTTKRKTPFTARITSVKSGGIVWGYMRRESLAMSVCGLIRGDEEVQGLKNHCGQGGTCKISGRVSNKTNPVGCERLR